MTENSGMPSDEVVPAPVAQPPATPFGARGGMWSSGTGDTSGYSGIERVVQMPGTQQAPYGGWFDTVAETLLATVPGLAFERVTVWRNQITFFIPREQIADVCRACRDDAALRFECAMSLSGVHYPADKGRELHVVYQLLSYTHNRRISLEVSVGADDPHVPSVVGIYPMVDYHEREVWDMFGVVFDGHPGLTRILMPDDWNGHPQRKDYPLGGVPIEYKGAVVPPVDQRRRYNA